MYDLKESPLEKILTSFGLLKKLKKEPRKPSSLEKELDNLKIQLSEAKKKNR